MERSAIILGGGAAGITAAISAARNGRRVTICERMPALGRKILASGNGRCNLLNDRLDESYYNPPARSLVRSIFAKFGKEEIIDYFKGLGLEICPEDERYFPVTNQSSSVLKVLELELSQLSVAVELNFEVAEITCRNDHFTLTSKSGKKIESDSVIVACGGKTYPALGSNGSAYKLAAHFGHKIIEPVPAAVPLVMKDPLCHPLQGQKIRVCLKGPAGREFSGDLLFTKYGLSGTAILDISEEVSIAIHRHGKPDVIISADMAPFMSRQQLKDELLRRLKKGCGPEDLLAGILPNKFGPALRGLLNTGDAEKIAAGIKDWHFKITGTRGWNEADFTAGGIAVEDIQEGSLESKLKRNLYFAGEVLDVNGRCGGYNLAWAWASGYVAGSAV